MEYYSALNRKEILQYVTTWETLKNGMLNEEASHKRTDALWFHLCEVLRVAKIIKTKNIMVVVRGRGETGDLLFSGYRVSILQDENCEYGLQ